jgi:Family of unknown function (DUF5675)
MGGIAAKLNVKPLMPEVLDVPNRSNIRIHWGNYPKDTEGCILVGLTYSTDFIGQSILAFTKLYTQIIQAVQNGESLSITITEQ